MNIFITVLVTLLIEYVTGGDATKVPYPAVLYIVDLLYRGLFLSILCALMLFPIIFFSVKYSLVGLPHKEIDVVCQVLCRYFCMCFC